MCYVHRMKDSIVLWYQSRNKPILLQSPDFLTKNPKQFNEGKKVFSTNGARIGWYPHAKQVGPLAYTIYKN